MNRGVLLLAIALVAVTLVIQVMPESDAVKASGTSSNVISSKLVCGAELCNDPLSIEEKIKAFLKYGYDPTVHLKITGSRRKCGSKLFRTGNQLTLTP